METTTPAAPPETTIMSVWPSISALAVGRWLGRLYQLGPQITLLGIPFRPGWFIAVATLPIALFMYFNKIVPRIPFVVFGISNPWCMRYRLTTARVVNEHPIDALSNRRREHAVRQGVALGEFDAIDLEQQPGQAWFRAADLVFRRDGVEVLRLPGVPHAEAFRQTCLKANVAHTAKVEPATAAPETAEV